MQVARDGEEHRRLQARRHRLPGVHIAQDDGAVHRGANHGAIEVDLRLLEQRFALLHCGLGADHLCGTDRDLCFHGTQLFPGRIENSARLVAFRRREEVLLDQGPLAQEIAFGFRKVDAHPRTFGLLCDDTGTLHHHGAACRVQIGARLRDAQFERRGIDARDDLILFHQGIEIRVNLLDLPGYLRTDLHRGDRCQCAARGDGRGDRAPLDLGEAVPRWRAAVARLEPGGRSACGADQQNDEKAPAQGFLHWGRGGEGRAE